jgi:hypothetical protein
LPRTTRPVRLASASPLGRGELTGRLAALADGDRRVEMSHEQLRTLDHACAPGLAAGERYPRAGMATVER